MAAWLSRCRRIFGTAMAILMVAGGLSAGSVASPAMAAAPSVRWVLSSTSFTTAYATYSYRYHRPVLTGVRHKVATAVDQRVAAFFANAIKVMKAHDAALSASTIAACHSAGDAAYLDGTRTSTTIASIYRKRYLSIHIGWAGGRATPLRGSSRTST
jgi:hypothetical protein